MNTQETLEYAGYQMARANTVLSGLDGAGPMSVCKAAAVASKANLIAENIPTLDKLAGLLEESPEDPVALLAVQAYAVSMGVHLDLLELTLQMTL